MARLVPTHSERREVKDVELFSYRAFQSQERETRNPKQKEKTGSTYPNPSASDKKTGPHAHWVIDTPGRADEWRSQGGVGIKKRDLGSNFFFQACQLDLPTSLRSGILIPTPPWEEFLKVRFSDDAISDVANDVDPLDADKVDWS